MTGPKLTDKSEAVADDGLPNDFERYFKSWRIKRISMRQAEQVNQVILCFIGAVGLVLPDKKLYYTTLLQSFCCLEAYVLAMSIIVMAFGQAFGERIQASKQWKWELVQTEIWETTRAIFVVAGLITCPIIKSKSGGQVALTWSFEEATAQVGLDSYSSGIVLVLKTVVVWIAADGWTYLKHYLLHRPALFAFHKTHHTFVNPTSFASFAISPLEALWTFGPIILFCWPALIGKLYAPIQLLAIFGFSQLNLYLHCGYTVSLFERTLPYIYVNTSAWHNIHHEKTNSNFGEVSPFWDYVFGSYDVEKYVHYKQKFGWVFYDFTSWDI